MKKTIPIVTKKGDSYHLEISNIITALINVVLSAGICFAIGWIVIEPESDIELYAYNVEVQSLLSTDQEISNEQDKLELESDKLEIVQLDDVFIGNPIESWYQKAREAIVNNEAINNEEENIVEVDYKKITHINSSLMNSSFIKNMIANEGFRANIYKDSLGNATIGIGHCISKKCGSNWKIAERLLGRRLPTTITRAEAMKLLWYDLKIAQTSVIKNIPDIYHNATKRQKQALIEMAFNAGIGTVKKLRTVLKRLRNGDSDGAARAFAGTLWCKQIKKRRCGHYQTELRN